MLETPAPPTPPQPTANELQEGWRCASSYLRRRLLDLRSAAAASMPLRGSLEQVGSVCMLVCLSWRMETLLQGVQQDSAGG